MNILILTSIYPQEDDANNSGVTPVVQYFAREWQKTGNNVLVIHNSSIYPKFYYLIPKSLINKINSRFGIVIPNKKQRQIKIDKKNGVKSIRIPLVKIIPKTRYSKKQIKKQYRTIENYIKSEKFIPDLVVGHWEDPQIPLLTKFKEQYKIQTAITFHEIVYGKQKRYTSEISRHIDNIDIIGARSESIAKKAKEIFNLNTKPFICYSGIPDKYFDNKKYNIKKFDNKEKNSFLYVGRLIKRKNVDISISALKNVYTKEKFKFNIIGNGGEKDNYKVLVKKLELNDNVKFLGYKDRDYVMEVMNNTEVFIMVSNNETFGLVYIEAMSRGCIVIAAQGGGMDGIIKHGYNGFLCKQNDEKQLIKICETIRNMSTYEKKNMSYNAIETSSKFKDSEVANYYLNNIKQIN